MARILGQPSSDGWKWTINVHSTSLSTCPPAGLLKFDLHVKVKHTSSLHDRNPSTSTRQSSQQFFQFNFPTLRLFRCCTLNRTQYSSALHQWLRQLLQPDVVNDVTDHVIQHLFENYLRDDEIFAAHVQIDLNQSLVELLDQDQDQDPVDEDDDDVAGGLSEWLIALLMRMNEFPAPAKEELESKGLRDCSICLDDLVSNSGELEEEKNTNKYLFESWECGHIFHGGCMKKWLRISDSCPLCRLALSSEIKRILEEIMFSYRLE